MLKSLGVRNLKGLSGDYTFTARVVITGEDNGVGKTALLQAVVLDMFGHLPELGMRPIDTRELSSGEVMVVMSQHTDWTATQKWGKKYESTFVPESHLHLPVEMVSLGNFFKLSQLDQARALLRCSTDRPQPADVFFNIKTELMSHGLGKDELKLAEQFNPAAFLDNEGDWLSDVVDLAKARAANLKQQIKGAKAATSELVTQTTSQTADQAPTDLQPQIDEKDRLLSDIRKSVTELTALKQTATTSRQQIIKSGTELSAEIEQLKRQPQQPACRVCGGPIDCPTCRKASLDLPVVPEAKLKQLEQLRLDARAQKALIDERTKDIEAIAASEQQVLAELADLRQRQALWHQAQGKRVAAEQAQSTTGTQELELKVVQLFVDQAAAKIGQILNQSLTASLAVANQLVNPVLGFDLQYQDGRFGYLRRGRFVGYATLSGSERAVMTAGIGMALTSDSPERILLLDELGTMRVGTKKKFIDTVGRLIKDGVIHQMIATTPQVSKQELDYYAAQGVQVIDLKGRQP